MNEVQLESKLLKESAEIPTISENQASKDLKEVNLNIK